MEFLDLSIINTAVPTIARNFLVSPLILKFAVASYYLSLAIFIPISGWCADKFGTKAVFIAAVSMFTFASLMCGISTNVVELTGFRFLQGVGGAFMNPVARIIVLRLYPPKDLVKVQSMIFTPALLGTILGPFLGGVITEYWSWHSIFLVNIPIGLMVIWLAIRLIEQYKMPGIKPFDWFGFILIGTSLIMITLFVEMLNHYDIVTRHLVFLSGIIGVLLFISGILYCLFNRRALFDLSVFRINSFNIGFVTNLVVYGVHAGIMFMLPLMFQECFGLSPTQSGYLVLPIAISAVVMRFFARLIISKIGFNNMLKFASGLIGLAVLSMAIINSTTMHWQIVLIEVVYGLAMIMCGSATGALCYIDVAKERVSNVTSLDLTFRQFGSSIGVGLSSFCLTNFALLFKVEIFTLSGIRAFHYTFMFFSFLIFMIFFNSFRLDRVKL
jgi:EmrB/QacA subfamily drug resistance transporter